MHPPFDRYGPDEPATPVVVSVPHAGRDYPAALLAAARVAPAMLATLEDRYVDAVALAAHRQEAMLIQRRARAWIDLNRAEDERDPAIDDGAGAGPPGAKVRSGLGLVPRRTGTAGELWRRRWSAAEIDARIVADHRPYHDALATALARARARFGCAVLLDLHSMPPLASGAAMVVGDRHGTTADARFVRRAEAAIAASGIPLARNAPYAGCHILGRHARRCGNVHAIQLEVDRQLYLDAALDRPGAGCAAVAQTVRAIIDALAEEACAEAAFARAS